MYNLLNDNGIMQVAYLYQVDKNNLPFIYTIGKKLIAKHFKNGGLSTTPNACDNLYELFML